MSYEKSLVIPEGLRVSGLFTLIQQASAEHRRLLGGDPPEGTGWVLVRQEAEFSRLPAPGERVTLSTRCGRRHLMLYPRFTELRDGGGRLLLRCSALWTLMDLETRRFSRTVIDLPCGTEEAFPSLRLHRGSYDRCVSCTVPEAYVDELGHMNNARYFDLAEEILPSTGRLRRAAIEYNAEIPAGSSFTLRWGGSDTLRFLRGDGEHRLFTMELEYE